MKLDVMGMGATNVYHVAKDFHPLGYKSYCGHILRNWDIIDEPAGTLCKHCQKAMEAEKATKCANWDEDTKVCLVNEYCPYDMHSKNKKVIAEIKTCERVANLG